MKWLRRKNVLLTILVVSILTFVGCSKTKEEPSNKDITQTNNNTATSSDSKPVDTQELEKTVVTVGDKKISYGETMIYVQYIKNKYESYFGENIWDYNFGGQTFEDMAKEEIMNMITQTAIISSQSKNEAYSIELTDEEEHNISLAADKFMEKLTVEEIARYGFSKELVEKFYRDNKLYERVYDAESMNVDTEVSNEVAKRININYIFLATTKKDASNETVSMTEEEKEVVRQKAKEIQEKAKELISQMEDEKAFLKFAKEHSQLEEAEAILGPEDTSYPFVKEAFTLKTMELSNIIEKEDGLYLLFCVSDFDKDATLEVKEEIISERQNVNFKKKYKEWASSQEINIKESLWKEIHLSNAKQELDEANEVEKMKNDDDKKDVDEIKNVEEKNEP